MNPHKNVEHVRRSPEVSFFFVCKQNTGLRTFLFAETTIMGHVYVDLLEHFLVPLLNTVWLGKMGPSSLSHGRDAVPEPNIPGNINRS
jgi:hypothetical protein